MECVESQPTFPRNTLPASAGSKLQAAVLLDLFFGPEDDGEMLLRNVGRLPTGYIQKLQRFIMTAVRTSTSQSE
jgi:hypothetical protein